jgi:prepilin-type N-terminal cleavage/methylation domain-containing protein
MRTPRTGTRGSTGFTLVEVMIGMSLIAILAIGVAGIKVFVNRAASDSSTRRDAYRVAEVALGEVLRNDRYILPQFSAGASTDSWFFTDETVLGAKSVTRCYDSDGKEIENPWVASEPAKARDPKTNTACPFMVSFFKVEVRDALLNPTDPDAAQLPMSRYRMKLRYRIRAPTVDHPLDPIKDFDYMELTRLVTHVIPF